MSRKLSSLSCHLKGLFYLSFLSMIALFLALPFWAKTSFAEFEQEVVVSGVIEIEAQNFRRKFNDPDMAEEKGNDLALATVEIGIDAKIHPSVQGHLLLLWEENESEDLQDLLDEGTITISNPEKCPYYLTAGKMYLPFGSFESGFVTDPLALELGEINETAVQLGYKTGIADLSFGLFNGDRDKVDEYDKIRSYFANLSMDYSYEPLSLNMGLSYLSNIADTDGLEGATIDPNTGEPMDITEYVQGLGVYVEATMGQIYLSGEYIGAIENFEPTLFGGRSCRPATINVEFGWDTPEKLFLGLKYEESSDMEIEGIDFNFAKRRYGAVMSYPILDAASLNLEYLIEKYNLVDSGKNNVLTAQLAIEF
ncbi:LbtU family siderophore porin [bacterium]|nr:LbtU family siderophore porin [bacterium]